MNYREAFILGFVKTAIVGAPSMAGAKTIGARPSLPSLPKNKNPLQERSNFSPPRNKGMIRTPPKDPTKVS